MTAQEAIEKLHKLYSMNPYIICDPSDYTPCNHVAVDTGMRKSWCKHCDVNMVFVDGEYKVV